MNKTPFTLIGIASLMCVPAFVFAADLTSQPQGVYSCQGGQYAQSIGSQTARGSIYVPVADSATELNSGILVYKECILRVIADRGKEAVTASLIKLNQNAIQTGRGGSPLYVKNLGAERLAISDATVISTIQNSLNEISPSFRNSVQQYVARGYSLATRQPNSDLSCSFNNSSDFWGTIASNLNPACNQMGATILAYNKVMQTAAQAVADQEEQWNWNHGWYSVTDNAANPLDRNILTPGTLVDAVATQGITSGFRQVENANDIGQMVGALFAGLGSQAITSASGLAGLSQPNGNSTSYLQQVVNQAQSGLSSSVSNAASTVLQSALQVEQQYYQAVSSIATTLTQTIGTIRSQEATCWTGIINKVCTATSTPTTGSTTCMDATGNRIQIATSTVISQAVITAQIAPYASSTAVNLNASTQALSLITRLIQSVAGSNADAQSLAIQQLNSLVSQHALHSSSDITSITQTQQTIMTTTQNLIQLTAQAWSTGAPNASNPYDPNSGWCNISDPNTITMWDRAWRQ